jgi:hypothetical protein
MAKKQNNQIDKLFVIPNRTWNVLIVVIVFLFYGNTIRNEFSMDDEYVTTTYNQKNKLTELGISGIGKIFTTNSFIDGKQNYEYRPIALYSFAIEWTLFKNSENRVHISHFINVLLYAMIGLLLFQLLIYLFQAQSSLFSGLIVILFLIHPIHSEVVNSLKNRDELFSLLFAILAAIYSFKWIDKNKWFYLFLALLFVSLSLLSKKSNLPFIVTIPLMLYFFRDLSIKKIGITFLALFSVKILFNLVRNHWMNLDDTTTRNFGTFENPLFELGFIERIPMFFYTNYLYLEKLLFPYPLAYYYGYDAIELVGFTDLRFYIGIIIVLIGLYFIINGFMKKSILSFGILFFFLAIGGVANLLSPMVGIFAERFAFSASIGFCIVIVYLLSLWKKKEFEKNHFNFSVAAPMLIIVISSFFYSINRNKDWSTKKSLYLADIDKVSKSAKANSLLASEYQVEAMKLQKEGSISYTELMQKVDSAIFYYDQSLKIFKKYESNLNNKGVLIYTYKYDYPEALGLFKFSISFNQNYKEGYLNCGNAESKIAEVYHDLLIISNSKDTLQSISNQEIDLFENQFTVSKMHQAVSIIKQFEQNLKSFVQNKKKGDIRGQIIDNALNLESLNSTLKNKSFATKISSIVNTKNTPAQQIYNNIIATNNQFRKELLDESCKQLNISNEKQYKLLLSLKNRKQKLARNFFKTALKLSNNDKNYMQIISQMALLSQDFEWIAELQEMYIQLHPKDYLGKNYAELINSLIASKNKQKAQKYCYQLINIETEYIKKNPGKFYGEQYVRKANALLTLENNLEAFENFRKGADEFKREIESLEKKTNKNTSDSQRIEMLKREIENLKRFKERIMNQKPIK